MPAAPSGVVTLLRGWHRLECWIAVLCFSFIAVVLAIDVVGREAYGPVMRALGFEVGATGLFGSQKLAVFALVIGSFAGIGVATATGVHLLPRVGFNWVPQSWGPAMDRVADVVTGVFLLGRGVLRRGLRARVEGVGRVGCGDQHLGLADPDGHSGGLHFCCAALFRFCCLACRCARCLLHSKSNNA